MAELPVSAEMFFNDFALDLLTFTVECSSTTVKSYQGLANKDEDGKHIAFLYGADVKIGDVLIQGGKRHLVKEIIVDTYRGEPALTKAYF